MIKLQFATLYSQRFTFAIAAFCDFILILAMDFAGWFNTAQNTVYSVWIQLGLCICTTACLLTSGEKRRSELFLAQKRLSAYLRSEWIVFTLICSIFALLWIVYLWLSFLTIYESLYIFGTMLLVTLISGHAILCNLQPLILHLPDSKRIALQLLTSVPWIIPAWLLGLTSSTSYIQGTFYYQTCLGLIALFLLQIAFGFMIGRPVSNQKNASQNHPEQQPDSK